MNSELPDLLDPFPSEINEMLVQLIVLMSYPLFEHIQNDRVVCLLFLIIQEMF